MRDYNFKNILYKVSALFILVFTVAHWVEQPFAVWGMIISVTVFSVITLTNPYPGNSVRGKRLFNFQLFACVLMVMASYFMYIGRNEWPLLLLISAIFLFYSSIVLEKKLKKENGKDSTKS